MGRVLSAAQRARVVEQREQRVVELQDRLQEGVSALLSSDGWRDWLRFVGRFRQYSMRNQLLILQQNPYATQVAGYGAWQAAGRQVRRGEKAIFVLGPLTRVLTDVDGQPQLDANGTPRRGVYGFKPLPVFDISQTDGPPLPDPGSVGPSILSGQGPEGMWEELTGFIESRGFTVGLASDLSGAEGVTRFGPREVLILDDHPPAHAASVLAHEAGHVVLHQPDPGRGLSCRGLVEVEAESFAFVVAAEHGLDSAASSFSYLAGWATAAAREQDSAPEDVIVRVAERVHHAVMGYLDFRQSPDPVTEGVPVAARSLELRDQIANEREPPPRLGQPHGGQGGSNRALQSRLRGSVSP